MVENFLQAVSNELDSLQQHLTGELSQDVERLQAEKQRLQQQIEELRQRYQQLQEQTDTLTAQPSQQQQASAAELSQSTVDQLDELLSQRLEEVVQKLQHSSSVAPRSGGDLAGSEDLLADYTENSHSLVSTSSHSDRLAESGHTYSERLHTYRGALSHQLDRLQSLQQQGDAIVERLVNRLSQQMGSSNPFETTSETFAEFPAVQEESSLAQEPSQNTTTRPPTHPQPEPETPTSTKTAAAQKAAANLRLGLLFALSAAGVLSLFNVSVSTILGTPNTVLGVWETGGLISPSFGNSLFILFVRMVVVVLLMPVLALQLYPALFDDIRRFLRQGDRVLQAQAVSSGLCLFASQVMIYVALGNIPSGVAVTILFVYPLITVVASWALFGDRPTILRWVILAVISVGTVLSLPNLLVDNVPGNLQIGVMSAFGAGITFAGYVLLTQICSKKLHPVPFSLVNFSVILLFSFLGILLAWQTQFPDTIAPQEAFDDWNLLAAGAWLGVLTLFSYLLNNFAIRYAGAALASIVGATGPAITALLALVLIGEALLTRQWLGMSLVVIGVLGLNVEKTIVARKKAAASK
jgi:drug/metabolite transporter (DMT)-like permease